MTISVVVKGVSRDIVCASGPKKIEFRETVSVDRLSEAIFEIGLAISTSAPPRYIYIHPGARVCISLSNPQASPSRFRIGTEMVTRCRRNSTRQLGNSKFGDGNENVSARPSSKFWRGDRRFVDAGDAPRAWVVLRETLDQAVPRPTRNRRASRCGPLQAMSERCDRSVGGSIWVVDRRRWSRGLEAADRRPRPGRDRPATAARAAAKRDAGRGLGRQPPVTKKRPAFRRAAWSSGGD
jgi:hypothetical protein